MAEPFVAPVGQHRSVHLPPTAVAQHPELGELALLPEPTERFLAAASATSATIGPLSERTRGVLWLSPEHADELARVLDEYPAIGWVQLPWAGVDTFREVMAAHPNILWTSAKGAFAQPVAEHALVLTLALLRILPERLATLRWTAREGGRSLFGLTVCIVGAGGIATQLIRLLEPFGVHIRVVRRSNEPMPGAELTTTDLREGIEGAHVVVLAAAHTSETERLIGAAELAAMRDDAILVNIARGALIDTDALVAALQSGVIAGAGIDVTDPEPLPEGHPLWTCPNTIVTPHVADTPSMTEPLLAERIQHNVNAWLNRGAFIGVVDPAAGY